MRLSDKKIALFVANLYEDLELWYPYLRMKEEGASVTIIGPQMNTFTGKHGIPVKTDKPITLVTEKEFDALIIPGGYSPDHMRRSPEMIEFVKQMNEQGKIIAAICHAGWMLVSAGIIKGKKVTSFYSIKDDVVNAGAHWVDEEVVKDGNIITSRKPGDLPMFCRTIIESMI